MKFVNYFLIIKKDDSLCKQKNVIILQITFSHSYLAAVICHGIAQMM